MVVALVLPAGSSTVRGGTNARHGRFGCWNTISVEKCFRRGCGRDILEAAFLLLGAFSCVVGESVDVSAGGVSGVGAGGAGGDGGDGVGGCGGGCGGGVGVGEVVGGVDGVGVLVVLASVCVALPAALDRVSRSSLLVRTLSRGAGEDGASEDRGRAQPTSVPRSASSSASRLSSFLYSATGCTEKQGPECVKARAVHAKANVYRYL